MGCSTYNYYNHCSYNCDTGCSKANNAPNRDTHNNDDNHHHNDYDYDNNDRSRSR
jgi:hypothetical protein